jgi:hypothetical protein
MGQRRGQGEIRQRADEVHRQRISPPELHEIALPAPQQYVRAHTNVDGCYGAFFERDFDKVVFLEQTLSWPHFGDPTFTFCDVERAVKRRLRAARVIDIFRLLEADGASSGRSRACRRNTESEHRCPIWRPLARKFPPDEPTTPMLSVTS